MAILYEACVTSIAQAHAAERAGAGRLELCARIGVGGLTPPMTRLAAIRTAVAIPIHVMIRPRPGHFVYSSAEIDAMTRAIAAAREAEADGIVLGLLTADRRVDTRALRALLPIARGLSITVHRAFDEIRNPVLALEELIALGVNRILTSGGAPTAQEGTSVLRRLVRAADGRIGIIACGKVRAANAAALVAATGVPEIHAHLKSAASMRALAQVAHGATPR